MTTTLTGPFGAALQLAAHVIADTPAFRVWIDSEYDPDEERTEEEEAAARAAALLHVHFVAQRDTGYTRPAVVIALSDDFSVDRPAQGFNVWPTGAIEMTFENTFDSESQTALHEPGLAFMDDVLGIIAGMMALVEADVAGLYPQAGSFVQARKIAASSRKQGEAIDYFQWEWRMDMNR